MDKKWKERYQEVLEFKKRNGKFPNNSPKNKEVQKLYYWIENQKMRLLKQYEGKELEEIPEEHREKIKLLREIGIEYQRQYEKWDSNYEKLLRFKKENGKLPSSKSKDVETRNLGVWMTAQRQNILKPYIGKELEEIPEADREKVELLRKIGIEYRSQEQKAKSDMDNWNSMLQLIIEFKERNGRFPRNKEKDENSRKLGKWLERQKTKRLGPYIGKELEEIPEKDRERVKLLREIGVEYNPKNQKFEDIIEMNKRNQELSQLIEKAEQLEKEYIKNTEKER